MSDFFTTEKLNEMEWGVRRDMDEWPEEWETVDPDNMLFLINSYRNLVDELNACNQALTHWQAMTAFYRKKAKEFRSDFEAETTQDQSNPQNDTESNA